LTSDEVSSFTGAGDAIAAPQVAAESDSVVGSSTHRDNIELPDEEDDLPRLQAEQVQQFAEAASRRKTEAIIGQ